MPISLTLEGARKTKRAAPPKDKTKGIVLLNGTPGHICYIGPCEGTERTVCYYDQNGECTECYWEPDDHCTG